MCISGSGLGYFIFGRQRQELADMKIQYEDSYTDGHTDIHIPTTGINNDPER